MFSQLIGMPGNHIPINNKKSFYPAFHPCTYLIYNLLPLILFKYHDIKSMINKYSLSFIAISIYLS